MCTRTRFRTGEADWWAAPSGCSNEGPHETTTPSTKTRSCPEETAGWWRIAGDANGANPIAIVLPCHRAIGAIGAIGGFDAGQQEQ